MGFDTTQRNGIRAHLSVVCKEVTTHSLTNSKKDKRMEMDFSKVNLEYFIQARDFARQNEEMLSVLLGMSPELAHLLAKTTAQQLAHIAEIKPPLLVPRQEAWWWQRFLMAVREDKTDELKVVMEHASLMIVPELKKGS